MAINKDNLLDIPEFLRNPHAKKAVAIDKDKAISAQNIVSECTNSDLWSSADTRMVDDNLIDAAQLRELFYENEKLKRDNEKLKEMVAKYVDIAAVGQQTLLETISTNVISPR